MIKLSAVIITFNEERNIGRCLASLTGIADEIIVVDSGSTDGTKDICAVHEARFIHRPFDGFASQKNFANNQASFDHILSLDADEALSPDLRNSIFSIKANWEKDGYSFNRLTNYCGKWIRHCGWYPDRKLRLFRKSKGRWGGPGVHEHLILSEPENSGRLNGDLYHYSYYSVSDHVNQLNRFTDIAATDFYNSGKRTSVIAILIKPVVRFIRDYFFKLGFLDGYSGLIICLNSSYAVFIRSVKLLELQKRNRN